MNKRFKQTTTLDPGRFRYQLSFLREHITIAPDGSQQVDYIFFHGTRAVKEEVSRRVGLSLEGYLKLFGDASDLLGAWVFTIRKDSTFMPTKYMLFRCEGDLYTPRIIQEVNQPTEYIKILAVKTDPLTAFIA